jgi:hypothetical protein
MRLKKFIASVVATALVGTTFAVTGATMSASADTIGQAYLIFSNGVANNWNPTDAGGSIDITGNGSYTISFDIPADQGSDHIEFLGIETNINIYEQDATETEIYKDMTFNVDSITVDGVNVAYTGPSSGTNGTADNGTDYRLSIYDTWSGRGVTDIDASVDCAQNVTISFTVSGIKEASSGSSDTESESSTTEADSSSDSSSTTTTTTSSSNSSSDSTTTTTSGSSSSSSDSSSDDSDSDSDSGSSDETVAVGNAGQGETSDAGVASVVLVFALAGASVVATRKKK